VGARGSERDLSGAKLIGLSMIVTLVAALSCLMADTPRIRFEPTVLEKPTTRGPEQVIDTAWEGKLIEIQRRNETAWASLLLMQATDPIRIDGTIPLWGVVLFVIGIAGSSVGVILAMQKKSDKLESKLDAHIALDAVQFSNLATTSNSSHADTVRLFDEIMRRLDRSDGPQQGESWQR